ncbi:MAG: adenylyl-sulfate kinase, partial [Gammaproteobacteria bacterium]|nr:adenylyl-sulfate kinase [Gammaproteobacteria bacterium]
PLDVCEQRDVKGLYKRARAGEIKDFTGISSPYEAPVDPELAIETGTLSIEDSVAKVMALLRERGIVRE